MFKFILFLLIFISGISKSYQQDELCKEDNFFSDPDEKCVKDFICEINTEKETYNWQVQFYEDCDAGQRLFTFTSDVKLEESCAISVFNQIVSLPSSRTYDAEANDYEICIKFIIYQNKHYNFKFTAVDVNEFPPSPKDISLYETIQVLENKAAGTVLEFYYEDNDVGEIDTMTFETVSGYESSDFKLTEAGKEGKKKKYNLETLNELDFETKNFHNLKFKFESSDSRGNKSSTEQTINVLVKDVGDRPPFWSETHPSIEHNEGKKSDAVVFKVKAQDGDREINNKITYTIAKDPLMPEYFVIDNETGDVTQNLDIDREELSSPTINLEITASEVDSDGTDIGSSDTRVTFIYILDINDEWPEFQNPITEYEILELTNEPGNPIPFTVKDMDERENGTFTLSTNPEGAFDIRNPERSGNATFNLIPSDLDIFDCEREKGDQPLIFEIIATEKADPTHTNTITISITLIDVNDNEPIFEKEEIEVDVLETVKVGDIITTFQATDKDRSDEFNTKSIVYSLGFDCECVTIEQKTGEVTVSEESCIDFERKENIICTIIAKDKEGQNNPKQSTAKLTINIIDVNDSPPQFEKFTSTLNVMENTKPGEKIETYSVEDIDSNADILFELDFESVDQEEIKSWFKLIPSSKKKETSDLIASDDNLYTVDLCIGDISPDREKLENLDFVKVNLIAKDNNTEFNEASTSREITINIEDEIDVAPKLKEDSKKDLKIKENTQGGSLIRNLEYEDPDLNDKVTFQLREDSEFVDLFENGTLKIKEDAIIDYEQTQSFIVKIVLTDSKPLTTEEDINIEIVDTNDESPKIEKNSCEPLTVKENEINGTLLRKIEAQDKDSGVYKIIDFELGNDKISTDKNPKTPFSLSQDGEIRVLRTADKILDREDESTWTLKIDAFDRCKPDDIGCTVNRDQCEISVIVEDINDRSPEDFKIVNTQNNQVVQYIKFPESNTYTGEELKMFEIRAIDKDEPGSKNSEIEFEVISFSRSGNELEMPFVIETKSRNFSDGNIEFYGVLSFENNVDFTNQRGLYELKINASDKGDPPTVPGSHIFNVEITDANDQKPQFEFSTCVIDQDYIINVDEGWSGNLTCADGNLVEIFIRDGDEGENSEPNPITILNNSTVKPNNQDNQLQSFNVKQLSTKNFILQITEKLQRAKGAVYDLQLYVTDKGTPQQDNIATLQINVISSGSHVPVFCDEGPCSQTVYLEEGQIIATKFSPAKDDDNIIPEDDDNIIYYIKPGSLGSTLFKLGTDSEIIPIDKIDREIPGHDAIDLLIFTSNSNTPNYPEDDDDPSYLHLTVNITDVNDVAPSFPNDLFGSFLVEGGIENDIVTDKLQAFDNDICDKLTYTIDDFKWSDGQQIDNLEPFKISPHPVYERASQIRLNFEPPSNVMGYCNFTVTVNDGKHPSSQKPVLAYALTKDYIVEFIFDNPEQYVRERKTTIEAIFTSVFEYKAFVDKIRSENNNEKRNETIIKTHFLDEMDNGLRSYRSQYELVDKEIIEDIAVSGQDLENLQTQLQDIGLSLTQIGSSSIEIVTDTDEVVIYQILLSVVGGVLGVLVLFLIIAYVAKTKSLERKIKVLSTSTMPSQKLSRLSIDDPTSVPGSNQFMNVGSNPVFGDEMSEKVNNDDNSSISSGDSVLVGVEDNPEFRNYKRKMNQTEVGAYNPGYMKSIDEIKGVQSPFSYGTKTNPLANISADSYNDIQGPGTQQTRDDNFSFNETLF